MCDFQVLISHNAKVYLAARDEKKAHAAIEEIKSTTGKEAIFLKLDLASLSSVKQAADQFLRSSWRTYCLLLLMPIIVRNPVYTSCSTMRTSNGFYEVFSTDVSFFP